MRKKRRPKACLNRCLIFETVQGRSMNEAEQEAAQDAWNEIIEGGAE